MDNTDRRDMDFRSLSISLLTVAFLAIYAQSTAAAVSFDAEQKISDVRILIDVSGSMSVNDPDNRRVSALRLITSLMPLGSRAGVWAIDRNGRELIPVGEVDEEWKQAAWAAAGQINSDGGAANIEDTIRIATRDWQTPDPHVDRHLILLVDGYIDISDSRLENEASRQRVVNELLDKLRGAGATIHTIGLSDGADHQLLRHLAAATNGEYEYLEKATHLDRTLLHMFTNSVASNSLPLNNNQINVDSAVDELTLVAFRNARATKTVLKTPSGEPLDSLSSRSNITWRQENGYDVITIHEPDTGIWKVTAGIDPDNLVVIHSNLSAEVSGLANNISVDGEKLVNVRLTRNGRPIRDQAFLDTLTVNVSLLVDGETTRQWTLYDNGKQGDEQAGDGIFGLNVGESPAVGSNQISITVDGVYFQRMQRKRFMMRTLPVIATLLPDRNGNTGEYNLLVIPFRDLIDPASLTVTAKITTPDGEQNIEIPRSSSTAWRQHFQVERTAGKHEIILTVNGKTPGSEMTTLHLDPLAFEGQRIIVSEATGASKQEEVDESAGSDSTMEQQAAQDSAMLGWFDVEKLEVSDAGWFTVAWQVLLVNLLVIGAGYGGYWTWKRHSVTAQSGSLDIDETKTAEMKSSAETARNDDQSRDSDAGEKLPLAEGEQQAIEKDRKKDSD